MTVRSFIAVEIPAGMQEEITRCIAPLQRSLPKPLIRWVASQNVHLTLKFLGDVSPANLERLARSLEHEALAQQAFTMSVGGLGAFPSASHARVLWVGLNALSDLEALARGVEAVAVRLGFEAEVRPFSPHLTIGRVAPNTSPADQQRIRAALAETPAAALGSVHVDALHIFKSDLRPDGPIYTPLFVLPLELTPS